MDESANKGLESKGGDAEIPKRRSYGRRPGGPWSKIKYEELDDSYAGSSVIRRMVVKGYDTSPPREDVEEALRKHFASCGINLIHAAVPVDYDTRILCSHALIYVYEEFEAETLKLQGSDMGGGCILEISAYPFDDNSLDHVFAPTKATDDFRQRTLKMTGFDTSLDEDDIKKMLREIFPAFGSMVMNDGLSTTVFLHVHGQDTIEMALKLSGSSLGNSEIAVNTVLPRRKPVQAGLSLASWLWVGNQKIKTPD